MSLLIVESMACVLVVLLLSGLVAPLAIRNVSALAFVFGSANRTLRYETRQAFFKLASRLAPLSGKRGVLLGQQIGAARLALASVDTYAQVQGLDGHPGAQLLGNTGFRHGLAGWVQYNSIWTISMDDGSPADGPKAVLRRSGPGHGSLCQTLFLEPGRCYLFSAVGSAVRSDDIPTFWLYWEAYSADGTPHGTSLLPSRGNQPWERRSGVFCLPDSESSLQQVTVAPVSAYGDVEVSLGSVSLYELCAEPHSDG